MPRRGERPPDDERYLFSSFREEREGLVLAYSENLYDWERIPGVHLEPRVGDRIMRDPFLSRGPDGTFHLVWTSGWERRDVGYARSTDLAEWSEQRLLPLMEGEPATRNCWAPKIFYDGDAGRWQIVWSSWVDDGRFGEPDRPHTSKNHRIWYATTEDFGDVSDPDVLFDPGYSCIDAYLQRGDGEWLLFFKDERYNDSEERAPAHQNIRLARGASRYGPFGEVSEPITGDGPGAEWHNEGPCALRVDGTYYVFYDYQYDPAYFGATRSDDLETWEDVSEGMRFPEGFKHGHVVRVPVDLLEERFDLSEAE